MLSTASDGWGYFFLTCSPILDLGHFSQLILPIVLLIMPQVSGAVHSIWWLGLFFFDLFSHSGLRHFSQVILPIVLQIMPPLKITPTIRCCEQHLMVGVFFFWTCSPILDLGHFSQDDFANCTTVYAQPSGAVHSIWWLGLFFFDLFSRSGLRAFCHKWFCQLYYKLCPRPKNNPNHQVLFTASDGWGFFWPVLPFWT